jgi:hypothetical protein
MTINRLSAVSLHLSEASKAQIKRMDQESPKTAYLIDSDHGKSKLEKDLFSAGIDEDRVFFLPERNGKGLAVEDLIEKSVYLETVNTVLKKYNGDEFHLDIKDIPDNDRAKKVDELCRGYNKPSKRDVAYCLLEIESEGIELIFGDMRTELKDLVLSMHGVFEGNESGKS